MAEVKDLFEENETDDTMKDQYLTFTIDEEEYGIKIAYVKEIINMCAITKVPEMPNYVEGIINLRGELIGVLDVRKRFGKPFKEHDTDTCIIVVVYNEYILGFVVDAVQETTIIPEAQIAPPPSAKLNFSNQFIRNIGKVGDDVTLLLDIEKFLLQE
ncbi:MAG: chemotaxis protein CheW [Defluviitaleaceae bacterium]|nr:chemotaxis protein CheW [Defluviitaleaceae bacterium]